MLGMAIMLLAAMAVGSLHAIGMTGNGWSNRYEVLPAPNKR